MHISELSSEIRFQQFIKVMGTLPAICLYHLREKGKLVKGICGQVDGSIIPGILVWKSDNLLSVIFMHGSANLFITVDELWKMTRLKGKPRENKN